MASTNQGLTASQIRYKLILYFGNSVVEDKRRCRNARLPFTDSDRYTFQRKHAACGRGPQTYVSDTGSKRHLTFDTVLDVLLWLSNRKLFQTLALSTLWGSIGELRHPNLVCERSAGECRHHKYRPSSHHRRAVYQSHGELQEDRPARLLHIRLGRELHRYNRLRDGDCFHIRAQHPLLNRQLLMLGVLDDMRQQADGNKRYFRLPKNTMALR